MVSPFRLERDCPAPIIAKAQQSILGANANIFDLGESNPVFGIEFSEMRRPIDIYRYLDDCLNMKIQMMFEALSDENRRKILDLLKKKDLSVAEIAEHFDITGASLSHHLNKLKAADLVIAKRQGQHIIYSIHTSVFEDFAAFSADFFKMGGSKNEKLSKK